MIACPVARWEVSIRLELTPAAPQLVDEKSSLRPDLARVDDIDACPRQREGLIEPLSSRENGQ